MTPQSTSRDDNDITLRDVINHISSLKTTFTGRFDTLDKKVEENRKAIEENRSLIMKNGRRIDALDEDLKAVIKDSRNIRRHVGMPVEEY